MKVKVSHEVPLQLLNNSKQFNDYDYCLPHLLDIHPEYEAYFRQAKKEGRYIIMDNSLHELGEAYDTKRLMYWVNELKPNEFIVPDVWENSIYSIRNAKEWSSIKLPKEVTKVAVVQGKSYTEFATGYQSYKWFGYNKIAFSYGASWFAECFQHPNPYIAKMMGRLKTITNLYKNNIIGIKEGGVYYDIYQANKNASRILFGNCTTTHPKAPVSVYGANPDNFTKFQYENIGTPCS